MAPRTIQSLPLPKAAIGFRPEYLDFRRGIRVGNLEDHERITRILKLELEARYGEAFVTERYGRGVYWQWIGYLPRANRLAKPLSSHVSFGCAKLFVMIDTEDKLFKCGLQVERGRIEPTDRSSDYSLRSDWDWHRLVKGLKPGCLGTRIEPAGKPRRFPYPRRNVGRACTIFQDELARRAETAQGARSGSQE